MNSDQMDYEMDGQGGPMLPRPHDPGCVEEHRRFNPNTAGSSSNMSQQHPPPGFGTVVAGFNYWNHPDPSMHQAIHADSGRGAALTPNHAWMQQYLRHGTPAGLFAPPVASSPESPASNANNSAANASQTAFGVMYGHGSYGSSHSFSLGANQYMPANASNLPRLPPLDPGNYPARYLPHPQRLDYGSAEDRIMIGGHHLLRDAHSSIPVPRTVAATTRPAAPHDESLNTHASRAAMNDTSDTEEDTDEAEEHDEDPALEAYVSDARRNYVPASLSNDPERLRAIEREQRRRQIRMAQTRDVKLVASQACLDSLIKVDIATLDEADIMCVICYTDFGVESADGLIESPVRLPTCNHLFGEKCIRHWLKDSDSCPFCRHKLPSEPKHRKIRREGYREYRIRPGLSGDHGGSLGPEGRIYASYASGVPDHLVDGGHLTSAEHELLLNSYRQRSRDNEAIIGNGPPRFSATDANRRASEVIRREELALEEASARNGSNAPVDRSEQRRRARHRAASRSAASPNSYSTHSTRWSSQGLQPSSPPTSHTQQRDRGSALDDRDGHHGPRSITLHPTALESPRSLSMNASPSASNSASASASRLNPAVPEWNMNRGAPLSQIIGAGQDMTRNNAFDATVLHHRRTAPQHYLTQHPYMNPYYYPQPGVRPPPTGNEYLAAEGRHDRMARDEGIYASGLTPAEQTFLQNGRHMTLENGHPGALSSIDGFDFRQVGAGEETIHGMTADDSDIPSSPVNSVEAWPATARNNAGA